MPMMFLCIYHIYYLCQLIEERPPALTTLWNFNFIFDIWHTQTLHLGRGLHPKTGGSLVSTASVKGLFGQGFESRQGYIFSSPKLPRHSLGPNHPPIQWLPGFIPEWWSGRGVKLTTHLYKMPRLRMVAAIPLVPCMPWWCELGELYLVTTMVHTDMQKRPCVHCTLHTFLIFFLSFFDWSLLFRSVFFLSCLPVSERKQSKSVTLSHLYLSGASYQCSRKSHIQAAAVWKFVKFLCFIKCRPVVTWMCSFTHCQ
jgi:hypothetical protein